jgi:hypothetical protein
MIPRKSPIGVPILKYMYIAVMEKCYSTFYALGCLPGNNRVVTR